MSAAMLRLVCAVSGIVAVVTPAATSGAQQQAARIASDSSRFAWATITYRSGDSFYLDAGTKLGLAPGRAIEVIRGGQVIAELTVAYVSSTRSACTVVKSTEMPAVGDSVRFISVAAQPVAADVAAAAPSSPAGTRSRNGGTLRGRIGLRYFVTDVSASPSGFSQPAVDARLDGQRLGGTPLGVTVDVRAHRTRMSGGATASGPGNATRVYQAAVHLDGAGGPGRLTLGRQFATALSPVGLFDGAAADFNWRHAGGGLFAGSQPDVADFGLSSAIREYGAYARLHSAPGEGGIWSFTTGAIGSYDQGNVNREFLYLQGLFVNRALSLYAAQEVDYNRAWRAAAESTTTTPTSTFATARLALGPVLSLHAGYDNRRSVRLYRDFASPDVEFDDSFREGVWGGTQLSVAGHLDASFDVRSSRGGSSGTSDSWTAAAGIRRLTPLGLGARARLTRYTGTLLEGELRSASLELQPGGRFRLDVSAGTRTDVRPLQGMEPTDLRWLSADFDVGLGRSFYLSLSTYRERALEGRMTQHFASISYRF